MIDTVLVLLIGIGPKLALVPFLEITAWLDATAKRRVQPALFASLASGGDLVNPEPSLPLSSRDMRDYESAVAGLRRIMVSPSSSGGTSG